MNGYVTQDTLALMKQALAKSGDLAKSITLSTGLTAIDLQAPSKNLYPTVTPLRNSIARVGGGTGTATSWRAVNAIVGSSYDTMAWVSEGQRSARMSYTNLVQVGDLCHHRRAVALRGVGGRARSLRHRRPCFTSTARS